MAGRSISRAKSGTSESLELGNDSPTGNFSFRNAGENSDMISN